jgi:hypothetical protein
MVASQRDSSVAYSPIATSFCILRIEKCSERIVLLHLAFFACSPSQQRELLEALKQTIHEKSTSSALQLADAAARAAIVLPMAYAPVRLAAQGLNPSLLAFVSSRVSQAVLAITVLTRVAVWPCGAIKSSFV